MNTLAVIPARFASTRLPGKPLLRATGKFLIQHVYEQASAARHVGRVIVATDDERIAEAVRSFGGEAAMTRADHPSGTDRIAEVVRGLATGGAASGAGQLPPPDLILNVQGDEPEIDPAHLDRLIQRMAADPDCPMGTLAAPFPPDADPTDPNCVKVVKNSLGRALYFSRALIPYPRDAGLAAARRGATGACLPGAWYLHVGIYAYRRSFLLELANLAPSPLEQTERLEQLRVLENGHAIAVVEVEHAAPGIDTPRDYDAFVARWNVRAAAPR